jgi:hypothetical protein
METIFGCLPKILTIFLKTNVMVTILADLDRCLPKNIDDFLENQCYGMGVFWQPVF